MAKSSLSIGSTPGLGIADVGAALLAGVGVVVFNRTLAASGRDTEAGLLELVGGFLIAAGTPPGVLNSVAVGSMVGGVTYLAARPGGFIPTAPATTLP